MSLLYWQVPESRRCRRRGSVVTHATEVDEAPAGPPGLAWVEMMISSTTDSRDAIYDLRNVASCIHDQMHFLH